MRRDRCLWAAWGYGEALGADDEGMPDAPAEPEGSTLAEGLLVGVANSLDGTPA